MTALIIAEAAVIVLLGLLVAGLLRSHAEILRKLDSLGAGLEHVDRLVHAHQNGADGFRPAKARITGATNS